MFFAGDQKKRRMHWSRGPAWWYPVWVAIGGDQGEGEAVMTAYRIIGRAVLAVSCAAGAIQLALTILELAGW